MNKRKLLTLMGGTPQAIKDNRDIILTQWSRSEINPITTTHYTFGNIVYDTVESLWRLYSHNVSDNKIYMSTSTDCRNFGVQTLVLDHGESLSWDDNSIGVPFVWCEVGEERPWRMIYRGDSEALIGFQQGLATSLDGITWERKDTSGNALSAPVLPIGDGWDNGSCDIGGVIKVESTYYLYYNTIAAAKRKIGLATSTDLVTWTRNDDNPLYIGTVGADIIDATVDDDQGRFCADVVRWDNNGTVRYAMFVVHYVDVHTTPEIEVYTSPSPIFTRTNRSYVGTMFRTKTTPPSQQIGVNIDGSGTDTPRLVTDDITRNVLNSVQSGDNILSLNAVYAGGWNQELLIHNKTLSGKLEADGTLSGIKLNNITFDFPTESPRFQLSPVGSDANVRALWLPGQTKTMCDFSGNGIHLKRRDSTIITSDGLLTTNGTAHRSPSTGNTTDPVVTILESDRTNLSLELSITFASHWTTTDLHYIYYHGADSTNHHLRLYMRGGEENYTLSTSIRSGSTTKAYSPTIPVASISLNTAYKIAVCKGVDNKIYVFWNGTLISSDNFNYVIDDFSAADPPLGVGIGGTVGNGISRWDGYIDEIRLSNICRYTENYTPSDFVINYQSSGTIFTDVYDAGKARKGSLQLLNKVIPAGTSITVKARNASDIDDQSVTVEDFTLDNPTGQYHQYLITFATTDATLTPSITGAIPKAY